MTKPAKTKTETAGEDGADDTSPAPRAGEERPSGKGSRLRTLLDPILSGTPLSREAHLVFGLLAPMLVVLWNAWRVRAFTIDDAYISFRYAENLANGHGLVYNMGERVEGFTNFLWTVLLAGTYKLGAPTEPTAKILGALAACAALVPLYLLARRLRPLSMMPCLATWLYASSFLLTGYAVFGLETPFFAALTLSGLELFFREEETGAKIPVSGFLFALAALTRPEAPLFIAMLVVWQEAPLFGRRSLIRIASFAVPVAIFLLWRRSYYGGWVPNTLIAKTGDTSQQLQSGNDYVKNYLNHATPILWLGLGSIATSIVRKKRDGIAIASIAVLFVAYVILVGGDWMPYYRFLAPAEPLLFLLVDDALRGLFERRERAVTLAAVAFTAIMGVMRASSLSSAQSNVLRNEKGFWDDAAGRTAEWFINNGQPGPIAIADIGYVGYRTGYPIVDALGLLIPEIARLPGGYTRKVGPGYADAIFGRNPRYFVIISSQKDCKSPSKPFAQAAFNDPRFKSGFKLRQALALKGGGAWCIYENSQSAGGNPR